jgi:hypothetical protein
MQFFSLEADDYLERLGLIVGRNVAPDGEELVRLARALRGAALMAGLSSYSQAAGALEHVAKAYRNGQWLWTAAHAGLVSTAVGELKRLAPLVTRWSETESEAAAALARDLVSALDAAGVASVAPARRPDSDELLPSVRSFVAREGALVAGTLEHAAQAIELGQPATTADVVLQRLQALRGLAALPRLSPLPELLDAIELTMLSVRDTAPPPGAPAALREVAGAVTRVAREIVDRAGATADSAEVVSAARTLLLTFGRDDDVVEVRTLFLPGDPTPIVRQGAVPVREGSADPTIELVSLADRLRQASDQLGSAGTVTSRVLQLYGLATQVRRLMSDPGHHGGAVTPLLTALGHAIGSGRAERAADRFAALLRDGADRLTSGAGSRNPISLAGDLAEVVVALRLDDIAIGDQDGDIVPIESLAPDEPELPEPVPIESLAPDLPAEVEPVPIESLAPDQPVEAEPVPIEALAPDEPGPVIATSDRATLSWTSFELSFSTYYRLASDRRSALARPLMEDHAVVPIGALLYRGRRALERADVVRLELSGALAARLSLEEIQPLVSELIDLVPLALAE